jgi:hypothetical protein
MGPEHRARLSPLQPETVWTLEADALVERRGGRERSWPLATLKAVRIAPGGALLRFGRRRVLLPRRSLEGLAAEDRSESYEPMVAALAARAPVSRPAPSALAVGLVWMIGLSATGALLLLAGSAALGAWSLGAAFAARLLFVALLGVAVLPWLKRPS